AMQESAKKKDWKIIGTYVDAGESARTSDRPELKNLLKFCREKGNQVDIVMVHKIDRLARNLVDHATIKALLKQKNIRLVSVVENCEDSISGQLVENIMASIAEFYSANLGEEVKKGVLVKLKRGGWPHKAPLGYKSITDEHGKPYPAKNSNIAPLVEQAFELYSTGNYSLAALSEEIAERGLKTRFGKKFSKERIKSILANKFYIGKMIWQGKEYPGTHQPLISDRLFYRAQEVLRSRHADTGEKGKYQFLLRGKAYCQTCGEKLTGEIHPRGSYYSCIRNHQKSKCTEPYSPVKDLDTQLDDFYKRIQPPVRVLKLIKLELENLVKKRQRIAQKELTNLQQALAKLEDKEVKLADELISQAISRDVYSKIQQKLIEQKSAAQERLAQLKVDYREPLDFLDKCIIISSSLYQLHQRFDFQQRKNLLKAIFERIEVKNRAIVSIKLNPPFSFLLKDDLETMFKDRPLTPTLQDVFEQLLSFILSAKYEEISSMVSQLAVC
ncbi:MAG: recombinase family protein, partial [Candidatus Schekmanbacteria bacterium]|nr:recombinase family protein [Candidatus Schekmanbacteria bacterium]